MIVGDVIVKLTAVSAIVIIPQTISPPNKCVQATWLLVARSAVSPPKILHCSMNRLRVKRQASNPSPLGGLPDFERKIKCQTRKNK